MHRPNQRVLIRVSLPLNIIILLTLNEFFLTIMLLPVSRQCRPRSLLMININFNSLNSRSFFSRKHLYTSTTSRANRLIKYFRFHATHLRISYLSSFPDWSNFLYYASFELTNTTQNNDKVSNDCDSLISCRVPKNPWRAYSYRLRKVQTILPLLLENRFVSLLPYPIMWIWSAMELPSVCPSQTVMLCLVATLISGLVLTRF